MVDQILSTLLFLMGIGTRPAVQGESTASAAIASESATHTSVSASIISWKQSVKLGDLEKSFVSAMNREKATSDSLWKERRSVFQDKVQKIKDGNKKKLIEKLEEQLQTINKKRTESWSRQLSKLSEILTTSTEKGKASGKEIGALMNAVVSAEKSIAEAMNAVAVQAGKIYTIEITEGDSSAKNDVGKVWKQLNNDLNGVKEKVIVAKKSVETVILELDKLTADTNSPTPTSL